MNLVVTDPIEDPRWAALVASRPTSVFCSPAWLRVLRDSYGFPLLARMLVDDRGTARAGFVYAQIDDFLGSRIRSLPFSDFCDPVVDDVAQWRELVDELVPGGSPIDVRCLNTTAWHADERFAVAHEAYWHGLDLDRPVEQMWEDIHSAARRSIRKARAAGVQVRVASSETDLRAFFDLHLRVRKHKYGLLAQPYDFFRRIWQEFVVPGDGMLVLAEHDDEVVGGVLYLQWQQTMYYKFNASDTTQLSVRPNDLVFWEGVVRAHERGCRLLDFGISEPAQEGLVRYKRKYATQERTVSFIRHAPAAGARENGKASRALLNEVTALLVDERVPDDVSERGGEILYRYFT